MMDEAKPRRRVLDRMARIQFEVEPDEPCIISYHYEYKDFLDNWDIIDVSEATYIG